MDRQITTQAKAPVSVRDTHAKTWNWGRSPWLGRAASPQENRTLFPRQAAAPPGSAASTVFADPGFPPGVTQTDCDGPPDPLCDADCDDLWNHCTPRQQAAIAEQFCDARADDLRDALLDIQDGAIVARPAAPDKTDPSQAVQPRPAILGKIIWQAWTAYRDHALGNLHRRGEIGLPAD